MEEKIVGILGGMGPDATVDLFAKVIKCDPAETDQGHLRIIVDCNSKIPDRNDAYYGKGEDPAEKLTASAKMLEEDGCGVLIIPCNAAHLWHEKVQEVVDIPVLHIMRASYNNAIANIPNLKKVGLVGTLAMYTSKIYHKAYEKNGVEVISPSAHDCDRIMVLIREVKKGNVGPVVCNEMIEISNRLIEQGAQGIIAGCTEVPLVLKNGDVSVPVIDSTLALAQEAVDVARGRIVPEIKKYGKK
ncbi:MAG: amino acid racemase [Clostridiales bacterium]|nr:amino acid racemase [Clostridiales bacterium]